MGGTPFLGVELPDKFETNSSESAPEVSEASEATDNAPEGTKETPDKPGTEVDKPATPVAVKPDILDLDKHERVRFKGKDWSTKELYESQLRHEDYTRKVQIANEERKFATNFEADLDAVVENPALMSELKKIYPPRYVKVAEKVVSRLRQEGTAAPQGANQENAPSRLALDPDTQEKLDRLMEFHRSVEERVSEAKLAQDSATLDGWYQEFEKKYSEADQRVVTYEAGELMRLKEETTGKPVSKEAAKEILEKVFKADHEAREKRYLEKSRAQIQSQKAAQKKGQDMASGGGVPTAPAKKFKSMKEARAALESDAEAGRLS
jgi:hypothetical protein